MAGPGDASDLILRRVAFARLSDGQVTARGTAAAAEYRREGGRFLATQVSAVLEPTRHDEFGRIAVDAPRVEGEVPLRRGVASGGVQVHTERGDDLFADDLHYDGESGLVTSDRPVHASGPGYEVRGNGLVAKQDGSSVQLTHGAHGQLAAEVRP